MTLTSTGAGHQLGVGMESNGGGTSLGAPPAGACNTSWVEGPHLPAAGAGGSFDLYYCLNSVAGITSFSQPVSGIGGAVDVGIWEARSTLANPGLDAGANPANFVIDSACTSCVGVGLTLSGNHDFVMLMGAGSTGSITALSGAGFTYEFTNVFGDAFGTGLIDGGGSVTSPATWSQSVSGTAFGYAIAIQDTGVTCLHLWCGIIDPSRATDWGNAGAGSIPVRTTICSTLTSAATSATINAAIAACPTGQVVLLGAGTYTIATGIDFAGHSNVTLRGAGPTQTILDFTGDTTCGGNGGDICVSPATPLYLGSAAILPGGAQAANWNAGYAQGTTQITLTANTGLPTIGQVIVLDQLNDTSDTTGVFICDTNPLCQLNGTGNTNGRVTGGITRSQQQLVTVTGINGSVFTITPGLYANNWRSGQSPGAWWQTMVTADGIENMTVDHTSSTAGQAGIFLYACAGCWVKNVKSLNPKRNHVWDYLSTNDTVRDSYFYGTQNTSTQSYGFEPFEASNPLVENNIFQHIAAPILFTIGTGGVIGYNYAIDNYYTASSAWLLASLPSHGPGNQMSLMEGNELNSIDCDDIWGSGATKTIFRNSLPGRGYNGTTLTTQNTNPIGLNAYCRAFNIIGNVLGTAAYHTIYESYTPNVVTAANCRLSIYQIGYAGTECGNNANNSVLDDAVARNTLFRWGNYDTVNNAVAFNNAEVPTTAVTYVNSNPVPATHTLPASFYLSSKPAFFSSSIPFPPIGPDVTGGNISGVGGHANLIPAAACYLNTMGGHIDGTSGVLTFDASTCYYLSGPTSPTQISPIVVGP